MAAKGRKRQKKKSADEDLNKIYLCNLNFVPPKDQNLETIFEEPRQSKDGSKVFTSKLKYKRYLNFDPTTNKIQKRKRKAKKCVKKLKSACRVTRSSPKTSEVDDLSAYISILDDSSSDSEPSTPTKDSNKRILVRCDTPMVTRPLAISASSSTQKPAPSFPDVFETPKKGNSVKSRRNSESLQKPPADTLDGTDSTSDTQETILEDVGDNSAVESPKRSCLMS